MFVILAYDVHSKRVGKVLKVCRKYLIVQQKSVFTGSITNRQLIKLKSELSNIIKTDYDQVCIFTYQSDKYVTKLEIGKSNNDENIL